MSYKDLARELYQAMQDVDRLEKALVAAHVVEEEVTAKEQLREARARLQRLKKILHGAKLNDRRR